MSEERRILVAEDSATQRAQITRLLEQAGFQVTLASDGRSALRAMEERLPDAMVLDIVMPGMDGFELCRRVRSSTPGAGVPVVLLTSLSDSTDVLRGLEAGADSFVVKPCNTDYLPNLLTGLIENGVGSADLVNGTVQFHYDGQSFSITSNHQRLLKLLVSSFESAGELNRQLSEAHAQLTQQALQLKQKVTTQAYQIDQQVEERRNVESQLYHFQRTEAVDRLAGAVAHDFNNMLMVIQGFTDFLLKDMDPEDRKHKFLSEIRKASDRAAALTEQLLIYSRKQEFAEERFDLNRLLRDIHSMIKSILGDAIRCEYRLSEEPLLIDADKHQIEQVVVNLTTNARDGMPDGGSCTYETSRCKISADSPEGAQGVPVGEFVRLAVRDTGSGIPREILEHVFEPFFTTKEKGKGTGLGLSTVFGVIRKSGGHVLCSSTPGEGTEFSIYLPVGSTSEDTDE